MWTITKKCWIADYTDYQQGRLDEAVYGPARAYYRISDIAVALRHCSNGQAVDMTTIRPETAWNDYSDVGAVVADQVRPYRVVR